MSAAAEAAGKGATVVSFPAAGSGSAAESIPVMLGVRETAEKFGLPVHMVREAVRLGYVYSVRAGSRKIYINQSSMISWLSGGR